MSLFGEVLPLDLKNNLSASVSPTVNNDFSEGYINGALWYINSTLQYYVLIDNTTGAANWFQIEKGALNNYAATTTPTATDDSDSGYSVGSKWYDSVGTEVYICLDATVGAAIWENTSLTIDDLGIMATQDADAVAITGGDIQDVTYGDQTASKLVSLDASKKFTSLSIGSANLYNNIDSGIISGGELSINGGDNTKFDVSDGSGIIVDNFTNPLNPTVYLVSWSGLTAQTVTNLGTQTATYVFLNNAGALVQQSANPDGEDCRDYLILGRLAHTNLTNLAAVSTTPALGIDLSGQLRDLSNAVGIINSGNVISANGANLNINKTAGSFSQLGINFYTNNKNPSVKSYSSDTALTFRHRTQTGAGSSTATLDVGNYDLSGTITAITGTKYQNMRVFLTVAGNIVIQYGQTLYNSLSSAIAEKDLETFILFSNLEEISSLVGIISVRSTATDLSDSAQATFFAVSKFGEITGATGGFSTTTMQQAYDNSSTPEVLTDSTRGALTIKRGSAADTDNVLEIQNNAGTTNASITGTGVILALRHDTKPNVESLSATIVLTNTDNEIQILNPNGADRIVQLPPEEDGLKFTIINGGTVNRLIPQNDAGTQQGNYIAIGVSVSFSCNGTNWYIV